MCALILCGNVTSQRGLHRKSLDDAKARRKVDGCRGGGIEAREEKVIHRGEIEPATGFRHCFIGKRSEEEEERARPCLGNSG